MRRQNSFWNLLGHYKYLITIVIGTISVGFLGKNSFLNLVKLNIQVNELENQRDAYNQRNDEATKQLRELQRNPDYIKKIARERYFMKADNEDIFVLSTDRETNKENKTDETVK